MKIWLSKNSEIPVREQLVAQITLGVVSGDLPAGERIPSTREIARRFEIHSNTVGAAYKKLSENGLIELRRGSGFYVADARRGGTENDGAKLSLDALVAEFFRAAQARGFSKREIENHLRQSFEDKKPERIFVVEENEDFRNILIEEIRAATNLTVAPANLAELSGEYKNSIVAAWSDEKSKIETILPDCKNVIRLTARSVAASLEGETRPANDDLIAVASGWDNFLVLAKTVLVAANIEADAIVVRSTKTDDWRKGLENASMIICDALTAGKFPEDKRVRVFRLIADASLNELKEYAP